MAAYHFTAKIHSRAKGASAVRAAAYRAAERLEDRRAGTVEDYTRKRDVVASAILLPDDAPVWMGDRTKLWNAVEARERRKDAQLCSEIEVNLPREMSAEENWQLVTDFAREYLVAEGRICDIAMHIREAGDLGMHPHAHLLMPLREVTPEGFGAKHPDCCWSNFLNRRDRLEELREVWAEFARQRAASLGIELGVDWDHRSYADRGLNLEGQPKLGGKANRLKLENSPSERTAELLEVKRRNGERLLEQPEMVLEALTHRASTFSDIDLARWLHRHTADDQFNAVLAKARSLAVSVGYDDAGRERFSTPAMIALEARMVREAGELAGCEGHIVRGTESRLANTKLSDEQQDAARVLLEGGDLVCLVGHAGAGKSTMLTEVRRELEASGYKVRGAALSGIAAQNLKEGSEIEDTRTLASLSHSWENGRDRLTAKDVLIIDEAGMIGSKQLSRFITEAGEAGAKVILVGDPEQLQAIEAGAAFRAILERSPSAELSEIRRQRHDWQRAATRELATGATADALARYRIAGAIMTGADENEARSRLVDRWLADRLADPGQSQIMLSHTRANVRLLNDEARSGLRAEGLLGPDTTIDTTDGRRAFATGDRLLFTRNDRELGVRNGTIGTIEAIGNGQISARLDDGSMVKVDPATYRDLDHGYAVTIHKAQGLTVDAAYLYASGNMDRHTAYVGCTRHREQLTMTYSRQHFPSETSLALALGRERAKDFTLDYEDGDIAFPPAPQTSPAPAPRPSPELTDLERAFQHEREAAPRLEDAFRLKRDRGPHLRR